MSGDPLDAVREDDDVAPDAGGDQVDDASPDAQGDVAPEAGDTSPDTDVSGDDPGVFAKLFTEPADIRPSDVDDNEIVRLIREGITDLFQSPREALAYLAKSVIVALDKLGAPVGGKRPFPPIVYNVIGVIAAVGSVLFGTDDDEDQDDDATDREVVLEETDQEDAHEA